jgi:RNA polymerase sigma factor (sigma-70 family)
MTASTLTSEQLHHWAHENLGPSSAHLLSSPESFVLCGNRMRNGLDLEDAALSLAFESLRNEPLVATEFFDYFLDRIVFSGRYIPSQVRRMHDTADIVNSVIKDVWSSIADVEFRGRRPFMAYLLKRFGWKVHDKLDHHQADKRRDDLQVSINTKEGISYSDSEPTPSMVLSSQELLSRLERKILELPERERNLIEAHRRGVHPGQMAKDFGMKEGSMRKALSRARDLLNDLLAH